MAEGCRFWQGVDEYEAQTAVVLERVFARLPARELWRCGGVCRAWRRAANESSLWRHLLLPTATPHTLRAFTTTQNYEGKEWSWRREYALEAARWERSGKLQARGATSAPLQCAALHDSGALLALVDEDAHVTIWQHAPSRATAGRTEAEWQVCWSGVVSPEWRGVSLVQWAPHAARLLLAGRLALVDRYEMLVVHFDEEWCSRVVCRSAGGPGGAACWVDDDAFLSLRLRLLAPRRACTTVFLNAATQEVYSEFAGVTTPLLRMYNEAAAHISHILVADVTNEKYADFETEAQYKSEGHPTTPQALYYCAIRPKEGPKNKKRRLLIAAGGMAGGVRGEAQALLAWPLPSVEMPLLWVDDQLAQRVQQHRQRARAPEPEPAPDHVPDEDAVRALCTPPTATCSLHSQIFGIVLHPRGGCAWATTEAGATCVSLPTLLPLLHLPPAGAPSLDRDMPPHLLQPCVDDDYFVTPAGAGSGRISLWTARSGRRSAQLQHGAPALAAFLPPAPRRSHASSPSRRLLVLATDALHTVSILLLGVSPIPLSRGINSLIHHAAPRLTGYTCNENPSLDNMFGRVRLNEYWIQNRHHFRTNIVIKRQIVRSLTNNKKTGRARRGSCTPSEIPKCDPCEPAPRPPCRDPSAACPRGLRVLCCPPPAGTRPPCEPPQPPRSRTCENDRNPVQKSTASGEIRCRGKKKEDCGAQLDLVAMRLAAAECARRLDYEREVASRTPPPPPNPTPYRLAGEHECLRAVDGRDYAVSTSSKTTNRCDSNRTPPPPCPITLKPADNCEIKREHRLDPCAHHPRIFLEVDRSATHKTPSRNLKEDLNVGSPPVQPKQVSSAERITTRILKSLKRTSNTVCPRGACRSNSNEQSYESWCANAPSPKNIPIPCKKPSINDHLLRRPKVVCNENCNSKRQLHTKKSKEPCSSESGVSGLQSKPDALTSTLRGRMNLNEAGKGRVVNPDGNENNNQSIGAGGLELKIPPSAEAVRVRVSLNFDRATTTDSRSLTSIKSDMYPQNISPCSSTGGSDSWLSIRNLQKKISGYCKNEGPVETKKPKELGNCQRQKPKVNPMPLQQSPCSSRPVNKKPIEGSQCAHPPRSQSACGQQPTKPKLTPRCNSAENFLAIA